MNRFQLGNIQVDTFGRREALQAICNLVNSGKGGRVFTPNVDHVMLAETNQEFARAYQRASITLADGMPVVWASRLFGNRIRERVAGSDLILPLLKLAHAQGLRVFFFGSTPYILQKALRNIEAQIPGFDVVGTFSPRISDNITVAEVMYNMRHIADIAPDIIIVALGAPKQEIFIDKASKYCPSSVMIGLGASLDFLAGEVKRAPKWMQNVGLEWAWRLCQEPQRLWRRYLRDFKFPLLVLRQMRFNRRQIASST